MTIRQLWIRLKVILDDPASPLSRELERARVEAEEEAQVAGIDDALGLLNKRH